MRFLAAPYGPTTFFLAGELDLHAAPVIDRMFEGSAINRGGPVTIDMSAVTFCDLALAATPPGALDLMPSSSIILHGLRRNVFRLFKLLKLESRPIVCPTSAATWTRTRGETCPAHRCGDRTPGRCDR
jgi:anti-anti-sigma regulatory factor